MYFHSYVVKLSMKRTVLPALEGGLSSLNEVSERCCAN